MVEICGDMAIVKMHIEEIVKHIDKARVLWDFDEDPGPGEHHLGSDYHFTVKEMEKKGRRYLVLFENQPLTMAYDWEMFLKNLRKAPANSKEEEGMAKLSIDDQELREKIRLKCKNDWSIELAEDQVSMCIYEMEEQKLSLFHNQIWPNRRKFYDKEAQRWDQRITWDKSIDGYRALAHRSGRFAGIDETVFSIDDSGQLVAKLTVYRLGKTGKRDAFVGEARFVEFVMLIDEYVNGKKTNKKVPNQQWANSPHNQLSVAAERQALRKAFQDMDEAFADAVQPTEEPPEPGIEPSPSREVNSPADAPAANVTPPQVAADPPAKPESKPEEPKGTYVGVPKDGFKKFAMFNKEERIMRTKHEGEQWTLALDSGKVAIVNADGYETQRRDRSDNIRGGRSWKNDDKYYEGETVEKVAASKKDPASVWLALNNGFKVMVDQWGKEVDRKERKKKEKQEAKPAEEKPKTEESKPAQPQEDGPDIESMTTVEGVRKACIPLLSDYCREINGGKKVSYKEAYKLLTGVIVQKGTPMEMDDYKVLHQCLDEALQEKRSGSAA